MSAISFTVAKFPANLKVIKKAIARIGSKFRRLELFSHGRNSLWSNCWNT